MFTLKCGDGLELCMYEDAHAAELRNLIDQNREHLRAWLPWLERSKTVEDTLGFIRRSLEQQARNDGFQAGIWSLGKLVGGIGHRIDWDNRATSIGYWIAADHQGRGLVTRSCRALVDYAFNELKLNRVEIRCATGNIRSRAIPERLGFTQEGVLRQAQWLYDHYVDLVVYGMLAAERQRIAATTS